MLYALLFFALVLIGTGVLLSTLSYVERERILQDVGLASIRLFGAAIAIFVGVGLIHKEVDRRTIYTILSKPVSRTEFLLGKYAGLVGDALDAGRDHGGRLRRGAPALAGAPLEPGTPRRCWLAGRRARGAGRGRDALLVLHDADARLALRGGLYVVGHLTRDLRDLGAQSELRVGRARDRAAAPRAARISRAFNLTIEAVHGLPIERRRRSGCRSLYGALYSAVLLAARGR